MVLLDEGLYVVYLFWLSISLSIDLYSWDLFLRATPAFIQVFHQDRTKATILSSSRELVSLNLSHQSMIFLLFWRIKLLGDVLNILISKLDFFFWTCFKKKIICQDVFVVLWKIVNFELLCENIMYVFCICLFDVFNYFLFDVVNYGVIWDDFKKNDFFLFHFLGVTLLVLRMQECSFKKNIHAFNTNNC